MAGVAGGATGAVMAAIVMIFEMTLDYRVILPMTITVAFSYGVRKLIMAESIYIMKLGRRGHYMPESLQVNLHHINKAGAVMNTNFLPVPASKTVLECSQMLPGTGDVPWLLVRDPARVIGIVTKEGLAMAMLSASPETLSMDQIANRSYVIVDENMRLSEVISRMRAIGASAALVVSGKENDLSAGVRGIILKEKIADSLTETLDLFSD
jgi:CIC family chloride channel protein